MRKLSSRPKNTLLTSVIVLVAVIALVVFRLVEEVGEDLRPSDRFVVTKVFDGDTAELTGGDKIRLLAVDTPEKNEPLYEEARQFLERMVKGKSVRIEYAGSRRDRYGRILGYMYVDDTVLVNRAILANGLGYLYLFKNSRPNSPIVKSLLEAQRSAMAQKIGLAALTFEPETHYVASPKAFRFHRPGCRMLTSKDPGYYREITAREEALAEGLSPCRTCKP